MRPEVHVAPQLVEVIELGNVPAKGKRALDPRAIADHLRVGAGHRRLTVSSQLCPRTVPDHSDVVLLPSVVRLTMTTQRGLLKQDELPITVV
jgi:hypothetical protein